MSSNDLLTALLFFGRLVGFFVISPLFAKKNIPLFVRYGFASICTLALIPPLTFKFSFQVESPLFWSLFLKELIIGYLIGFLFALLFEAAALAGQVVGTLAGFSITELFGSGQENSIFTKLFALTLFTLFLALDLHHLLLRFIGTTFTALPLFPNVELAYASSHLFSQALFYAFIPFLMLSLLLVTFAIIARALPDLQIFWVGFPLQLLIGILSVTLAMSLFGEILQKAFFEFLTLAKRLFFAL